MSTGVWLARGDGSRWFVTNQDVLVKCLKEGFMLSEPPADHKLLPIGALAAPVESEDARVARLVAQAQSMAEAHENNTAARKALTGGGSSSSSGGGKQA